MSTKCKPVIEPATGQSWPSAIALIRELGCHPVTVYAHLRGDPRYTTVRNRRFQYQRQEIDRAQA